MEVEKRQWSEATHVRDLATSDIGLAPLPDNRFTRGKCGFKILQYAAAGLPVVASPVGVNAEYVRDKVTGFIAMSSSEWIDRITQLIENRQLGERMGQGGRLSVKKFDVSVIGKQLAKLITECLRTA
jgi:glycosyltransferase involved in cell wall biosynthesis